MIISPSPITMITGFPAGLNLALVLTTKNRELLMTALALRKAAIAMKMRRLLG